MSKIYDANGVKMGLLQIAEELIAIVTEEQKSAITKSISKYEFDNSQMKLAHGILDSYKAIDGSTEQGARVRKLFDNLMTKYQKSTGTTSADDQSIYHHLICELSK